MIRWIVFATIATGLITALVIGRLKKINDQFFWRRVLVLWGCLFATAIVAVAPIKVRSVADRVSNRDIIFVVDTTQSMNALDSRDGGESTRLDDARKDMYAIAEANVGASIGMYTFSDQGMLLLPLTTGTDDISAAIDTVHTAPSMYKIGKVLSYEQLFKDIGSYVHAQQQMDPTRQRVVVMMSDFEVFKDKEQVDTILGAANNIPDAGAGFVGMVYGTTAGAKMLNMAYNYTDSEFVPAYKMFGGSELTRYLHDNYETVVSKANPELANNIARKLGGTAIEASKTQDTTGAIVKAAKHSGAIAAKNKQSQALNQNIFYTIPAFFTFVWLILAVIARPRWLGKRLPKRSLSKQKRPRS